jgi:F-type H+-transporting ATPase subunit a
MTYNNPTVDDEKHDDEKHDPQDGAAKDGHGNDDHETAAHDHSHSEGHEHGVAHAGSGHSEKSGIERSMDYYLSPDHLIGHVQDAHYFEGFGFKQKIDEKTGEKVDTFEKNQIKIPWISPWTEDKPFMGENAAVIPFTPNDFVGPATFQPSKFVILELIGALILCAVFIPFARKIRNGDRPTGRLSNMLDATLCYVRDEIALPGIGSQDTKRFLPFVWTIFFFVLVLNLIGMVPGFGAATGSISVTAALALAVFFVVMATGMKKMGVVGFLKAQAPHLDIHPALKLILVPMIWAIEVFGLMIKHMVLAVRLFANMFAGHLVLGVFVAFIGVTWGSSMVYGVAPVTILASIAISVLELLVAFIQAYVFAFLTSLFIGAAIHPH